MAAQIGSLDEALEAVAKVGVVAREHAQKAEDIRALPVEVVDAITDAGLWGVFVTPQAGGSGLAGLVEQLEIIRALAYEDGSAGWALFICGTLPAVTAARISPSGRERLFGRGCTPMAGTFNPGGTVTAVDGGWKVTGKWPFASGIGYSTHVVANAIVLGENGAPKPGNGPLPEVRALAVPQEEVTLVDDWHVAGLRGTGSMTYTMTDHFVPDDMTFNLFGPPIVDDANQQMQLFTWIGSSFSGMAIGMAQRAIDEICSILPNRVGPPTFKPQSEDAAVQATVGKCIATVRAAYESTRSIYARYDARVAKGESLLGLPVKERSDIHQHRVWVAQTCADVCTRLFHLGGANSIYEPGTLQRIWRDSNVLLQHAYLRDVQHEFAGRIALGIEEDSPFI